MCATAGLSSSDLRGRIVSDGHSGCGINAWRQVTISHRAWFDWSPLSGHCWASQQWHQWHPRVCSQRTSAWATGPPGKPSKPISETDPANHLSNAAPWPKKRGPLQIWGNHQSRSARMMSIYRFSQFEYHRLHLCMNHIPPEMSAAGRGIIPCTRKRATTPDERQSWCGAACPACGESSTTWQPSRLRRVCSLERISRLSGS